MQKDLYPIFLKIADKPVLVVGAGSIAYRKINALLQCGADVTVVSPEAVEDIKLLAEKGQIQWKQREFEDQDVNDCFLIVASTSNREINVRITELARANRIYINVVDVPDLCDFYVPSIVDRSPLKIAISTEGMAPAFARRIRKELEMQFPESIGKYVMLLGSLRESVRKIMPDMVQKAGMALASSKAMQLWNDGKHQEAEKLLKDETDRLIDNN